jgi:hypothetical protein
VDQGQGDVGRFTSLVLDRTDYPHISYCGNCLSDSEVLKYAYWTGTSWMIQTVDTGAGEGTSLRLDGAGNPHISYNGSGLRYAYRTDNSWNVEMVDSQCGFAEPTSLVFDSNDNPRISYSCGWATRYGGGSHLRYTQWTGDSWVTEVVDNSGQQLGLFPSLVLDQDDRPCISYYDYSPNYTLKYAQGRLPVAYRFSPSYAVAVDPGAQAVYTHTLRNIGISTDTYMVSWTTSQNWAMVALAGSVVTSPITTTVGSGQTITISVMVTIPDAEIVRGLIEDCISQDSFRLKRGRCQLKAESVG